MLIQDSAEQIGASGYSYWSGKPINSDHDLNYTPQTIADGWEAQCSCGEWRVFASFYEHDTREKLFSAIKKAHAQHVGSLNG